MTDNKEKEFVNVFGKKFMGGPLGLGDPDDLTLRQLEDQVCFSFNLEDNKFAIFINLFFLLFKNLFNLDSYNPIGKRQSASRKMPRKNQK